MGTRRLGGAAAICLVLAAGACLDPSVPSRHAAAPSRPTTEWAPPALEEHAAYPVGLRVLHLRRGRTRPLPTLIFYPAAGPHTTATGPDTPATRPDTPAGGPDTPAGGLHTPEIRPHTTAVGPHTTAVGPHTTAVGPHTTAVGPHAAAARPRAAARSRTDHREPAPGRFPLVLFNHGLSGSAERYAETLAAWAAAGFVVAAPTYPYTSEFSTDFRRRDVANQPADARYVLDRVLRLSLTRTDPLWHRIDTDHQAAIGHSAGGYTTTGLLTAGHDPRLRAGVIMAGWVAPGAFAGPPATVLFVQGTADPIVPVARSRAAYARVPWPKLFLLLRRDSHATYLRPGDAGYARMAATVTAFLRWTLNGDEAARRHLPRLQDTSVG